VPARLESPQAAAQWLAERVRGTLRTDSRAVQPGDGFIAWPGHASDGRQYVAAALAAGAAACLVEDEAVAAFGLADARVATLAGLKAAAGAVADAYYTAPSQGLAVVATTGTNGKTSTAWWTAQALTQIGRRCGFIGTLGIGEPPPAAAGGEPARAAAEGGQGTVSSTGLTTPDPVTLHGALRRFADQGYAACAIEASSIGVVEHRLDALRIAVALFTNLTRDHLDYHGGMAAYGDAKRALFAWPGLRAAVINVDDGYGAQLADDLAGDPIDLWTVSLQRPARLRATAPVYLRGGLAFEVLEGEARVALKSALVGAYNASNLLVVIGGLRALGVPLATAAAAAGGLTPVPGRLQRIAGPDLEVVIDYAHTPDALEKVLQALRPLAAARGGRLWCVFGCGGNRDATKRPMMGAIAARGADHVVVTSDNPRDEVPGAILAQILGGVTGHDEVRVIEDRREAIHHAVLGAAAGDVVLLAGKGHEDYQEIAGVRRPFSDIEEAHAALAVRAGSPA
jgi:UDP-N-acetylmuramoyl-L-alanyl-D-glutamate--2,6-diaminopimelate ligase